MNHTFYVAFKFLTEFLVVVFLYVFPYERKNKFALRVVGCLVVCYLASWFTSPILIPYYYWEDIWYYLMSLCRYTVIFSLTVFSVWICFRMNMRSSFFVCAGAFAIQHLVLKVQNFIENFYVDRIPLAWTAVLYVLFLGISFTAAYFLVIRRMHRREFLCPKRNDAFTLCLLVVISLIVLSVFNSKIVFQSVWEEISCVGYGVICCIFLLCLQLNIFQKKALEQENEQIEYILSLERKQFEKFREGVSYLDEKCHDLKHQIHILKENALVGAEAIKDLESGIAAYESYMKTGCPALDIVIGEKYLYCVKNHIEFIVFCSGNKIGCIRESDIYSLFGNALDNAIEYEMRLEEEKRVVRLTVKDVENMLFIRVENYYEGAAEISESDLETTKADRTAHGFGIRSMRRITERYGGEMSIENKNGMFCLNFVFTFEGN